MSTPVTRASQPAERSTRAVLFDWNGTLKDMHELALHDQHVVYQHSGRVVGLDFIKSLWTSTLSSQDFFNQLFGQEIPLPDARRIINRDIDLFPRKLLPGVRETLPILKAAGFMLGIITSGPEDMVRTEMQQSQLPDQLFEFIHTGTDVEASKAAGLPDIASAVGHFARQGIDASEVVLIGDEPKNIQEATAAGIGNYLLVAAGTLNREQLIERGVCASQILDNFTELPAALGPAPR